MRAGVCAVVVVSACYAPNAPSGAPCEPTDARSCPTGQRCQLDDEGDFVCAGGLARDPPFCLGDHMLSTVCLATPPTVDLLISENVTIRTASTGAGQCSAIIDQPIGRPVCVIAARDIQISGVLRAIGPNPLVLAAVRTLQISGVVDASSRLGELDAGTPVVGAGARPAADCTAIGLDGRASNGGSNAGGGGAGGSFGSTGGRGGDGSGPILGGQTFGLLGALVVAGGCPGGRGGDGTGGGGGGTGGAGGGAVYLYAGVSIDVLQAINASGAGGALGGNGLGSSGGAGGGGAGGGIVLEAPSIQNAGALFANGGGGGGGGGHEEPDLGTHGADPIEPLSVAMGGLGGADGGGAGGNGAAGTAVATRGTSGSNTYCGGGGGGGGGGVIRFFGDAAPASGTISPSP